MFVSNNFNLRNLNFDFNNKSKSQISMGKTYLDYDKYQKKDFEKLINEGKTYSEMTKILGIPITTIRSVLHHYGLKTSQAKIMENISVDEVKEMIANGATQHQIAQHYGVSTASMTAFFRKHKLHTDLNIKINSMTKEDWAKYVEEGYTIEAIANELGISTPIVSKTLSKLGLTNNTKPVMEKDLPVDEIIEMYDVQKAKIKDIAEKYKITKTRVANILKKRGFVLKSPINIPKDELKKTLEQGHGLVETASIFGVSPGTITAFVEKYDLQNYLTRKKHKMPEPEVIKALIDDRLSVEEIALALSIPARVVKKTLTCDELKPFTGKSDETPRLNSYLLAKLLLEGDSIVQIAEILGQSVEQVNKNIGRFYEDMIKNAKSIEYNLSASNVSSLKIPENKKSPSREELTDWIEENEPFSYKDISEHFHISTYSARYLCEKYDLDDLIVKKNC